MDKSKTMQTKAKPFFLINVQLIEFLNNLINCTETGVTSYRRENPLCAERD